MMSLKEKLTKCQENLDQILDDVANNLANQLRDGENVLLSKSALEEQIGLELAESKERLQKGVIALYKAIKERSLMEEQDSSIAADFLNLLELVSFAAEQRAQFIDALSEGRTLQEIGKISDATIERMYQAAKELYEANNFEEARDAFSFLTLLNGQKFAFWLGLANCELELKNYDSALYAYAFASKYNPEDYLSHIFAAECYGAMGDADNRKNALEIALDLAVDVPQIKTLIAEMLQQGGR